MKRHFLFFHSWIMHSIWIVACVVSVSIYISLLHSGGAKADTSIDGNFTITPETPGIDDVVAATDTEWVFTVTTTAALASGDVVQFTLPTMSAGSLFSFGTVTSTALSGITFYTDLGGSLSNLLDNPSFEDGDDPWNANGGMGTFTTSSTSTAYDGSNAVVLYAANDGESQATWAQLYQTPATSTNYTYSFYARGAIGGENVEVLIDAGTSGCVDDEMMVYDHVGLSWGCVGMGSLFSSTNYWFIATTTAEFQRFEFSLPSHPTITDNLSINFVENDGETFIIDAVQLEVGSSATTYNAGGITSPTAGIASRELVAYGLVRETIATSTAFSVTIGGITNGSSTLPNVTDLDWEVKAGTPTTSSEPWGTLSAEKFSLTASESLVIPTPSNPSGFVITTVATTTIGLTWTDNSNNETGFVVQKSTNGSDYTTVTTTAANATSTNVTNLTPNTSYYFRVAGTNGYGNSAYITSSIQYTNASVPISVTASGATASSMAVSWGANNNSVGTVYELFDAITSSTIATTTDTSYTISGLTANTSYQFKVRAQYLSDNSTWTDWSSVSSAVSTASPSSGGSSSSSPPPPPPTPSTMGSVAKILDVSIGSPTSVLIGNSAHTITLNSIGAQGQATIIIESDPIAVTLLPGEEKLVDTDSNGKDDLFVRYNSLEGEKANITLSAIEYLEFSINNALSKTDSREVTLHFNSPYSVMMLVSNHPNFDGASYENYVQSKPWTLSEGEGTKTVYVKFRTARGGIKNVSDTIVYESSSSEDTTQTDTTPDTGTEENPATCSLVKGSAYRYAGNPGIAYITDRCTKRWFGNSKLFFSYFTSYQDTQLVTRTALEAIPDDAQRFMPWGPRYNPQYGALVKTTTDSKVYVLLGGKRLWIANASVFEALGYTWNWIEDVDISLLQKYPDGGEISDTEHHANFTLIKYASSSKVYRVDVDASDSTKQIKRWIPNEYAFAKLGFRWDRIIIISDQEQYNDGPILE